MTMTDNDLYDGLEDEPDTELRECWELTAEERHIIEAFRGLTEAGRQVIWDLLQLAYRKQREAPDG